MIGTLVWGFLFAAHLHAAEKPAAGAAPQAEVAVLAGVAMRFADSGDDPDEIGYRPGVQLIVQGRGYVWSWLNAAIYHRRAHHQIDIPRGAAGMDYEHMDKDSVLAYSLGARFEPTYRIMDSVRVFAIVGIGWGKLNMGRIHVQESARSYMVRDRSGVFVEIPLGLGLAYEVIPRWLAIQAEVDVSPFWKQSGGVHGTSPYTDSDGILGSVGPMPMQTHSASFLFGVSLLL